MERFSFNHIGRTLAEVALLALNWGLSEVCLCLHHCPTAREFIFSENVFITKNHSYFSDHSSIK